MVEIKDIEKLALLARIKIEDSEKKELTKEIDSILKYVDQIREATVNMDYTPITGSVHNILRDDVSTIIIEEDRQAILEESPDREGEFIAVKKIIE